MKVRLRHLLVFASIFTEWIKQKCIPTQKFKIESIRLGLRTSIWKYPEMHIHLLSQGIKKKIDLAKTIEKLFTMMMIS